ncbi:MAG: hypothetical protein KKF67_01175 [Nanoarchaeota archaeon]|nr:hypothetical protein [Nanoarchaeota archaeon]
MEFSIIIKKQGIFYFFVQNLSEWHFSCRKDYNKIWLEELGSLSKKEKTALQKLKKVHQEYSFGQSYLGRYFFLKRNPWKNIENEMPKSDFIIIKNTFSVLKEKFESFYKKELPLLKNWQTHLNKKINNPKLINPILKKLNNLYNGNIKSQKIKIYLLPSTDKAAGGGAGLNKKAITLEISRISLEQLNRVIGIIWHEVIHLLFEKVYFHPLLKRKFPQDRDAISLIKEATASSLFPGGILSKKFLKRLALPLNRNLPAKESKQVLSLAALYVKKNKHFDIRYINKLYSLLYKLKGILR